MKLFKKMPRGWLVFLIVVVGLCMPGPLALASDTEGNWRSTYNVVMLWINFSIFAFLLVKFVKTPLMDFLQGRKEELSREIKNIEGQRDEVFQKIKETRELLEKSNLRLEEIRNKIIAEGEAKKQEIIDDARKEAQLQLQHIHILIQNQILQAKNQIKSELIDTAVASALERLPQEITPADEQKYVDLYLSGISRS
jgi:F-type H+-transporting ATPase subunit b